MVRMDPEATRPSVVVQAPVQQTTDPPPTEAPETGGTGAGRGAQGARRARGTNQPDPEANEPVGGPAPGTAAAEPTPKDIAAEQDFMRGANQVAHENRAGITDETGVGTTERGTEAVEVQGPPTLIQSIVQEAVPGTMVTADAERVANRMGNDLEADLAGLPAVVVDSVVNSPGFAEGYAGYTQRILEAERRRDELDRYNAAAGQSLSDTLRSTAAEAQQAYAETLSILNGNRARLVDETLATVATEFMLNNPEAAALGYSTGERVAAIEHVEGLVEYGEIPPMAAEGYELDTRAQVIDAKGWFDDPARTPEERAAFQLAYNRARHVAADDPNFDERIGRELAPYQARAFTGPTLADSLAQSVGNMHGIAPDDFRFIVYLTDQQQAAAAQGETGQRIVEVMDGTMSYVLNPINSELSPTDPVRRPDPTDPVRPAMLGYVSTYKQLMDGQLPRTSYSLPGPIAGRDYGQRRLTDISAESGLPLPALAEINDLRTRQAAAATAAADASVPMAERDFTKPGLYDAFIGDVLAEHGIEATPEAIAAAKVAAGQYERVVAMYPDAATAVSNLPAPTSDKPASNATNFSLLPPEIQHILGSPNGFPVGDEVQGPYHTGDVNGLGDTTPDKGDNVLSQPIPTVFCPNPAPTTARECFVRPGPTLEPEERPYAVGGGFQGVQEAGSTVFASAQRGAQMVNQSIFGTNHVPWEIPAAGGSVVLNYVSQAVNNASGGATPVIPVVSPSEAAQLPPSVQAAYVYTPVAAAGAAFMSSVAMGMKFGVDAILGFLGNATRAAATAP